MPVNLQTSWDYEHRNTILLVIELMSVVKLLKESGCHYPPDLIELEYAWDACHSLVEHFFDDVTYEESDGDSMIITRFPVPELNEDEQYSILRAIADNIGPSVFMGGAGFEDGQMFIQFYPGELPEPRPLKVAVFCICVRQVLDRVMNRKGGLS